MNLPGGHQRNFIFRSLRSHSWPARTPAIERRGEKPEIESQPWLELRRTLEEPVKGVQVMAQEQLVFWLRIGSMRPHILKGRRSAVQPERVLSHSSVG